MLRIVLFVYIIVICVSISFIYPIACLNKGGRHQTIMNKVPVSHILIIFHY